MFKPHKIVCPVDVEGNYQAALKLAREIGQRLGATIYALHVARIPNDEMDVPLPMEVNPHWEQAARAQLAQIAAEHLRGVHYELVVKSGIPDIDVVRMAGELGADLIVMATHGRKGLSHFLLGSVAERVVREASCPVLTVRAG